VLAERLGANLSLLIESLGAGQDLTSALGQFGVTIPEIEGGMNARIRAPR
jgi:hypothetical protein